MKLLILVVAALSLTQLMGTGCAQNNATDHEALARTVAADLAARRFEQVTARFSPAMAQALDVAKLTAAWDGVIGQFGDFRTVEGVRQEEKDGAHMVYLTCAFARGKLALVLAFDAEALVAGLSFVPPESIEGWKPPVYARADKFSERAVTVKTGTWELPGTVTMPKGTGPFPAVVLVHGSGPNDQDESSGPNKMFKDLAWGLAGRGVAVLRYEKRTHKYHTGLSADPNSLTVADETIDDARSAVALLAATAGIDRSRIFVAGHSLGAYVAPRIASGVPDVGGIIIMAGNTRPLEDLVVEQVRYIASQNGPLTPEAEKGIASAEKSRLEFRNPDLKPGMTVNLLGSNLPASYVLDIRNYQPGATAAALKIPILVLHGGRDYQVRVVDFEGWKKALSARRDATLKLYPTLNHHFMPGAGPSVPDEYQKPNHVQEQVIKDIAAWIARTKQ